MIARPLLALLLALLAVGEVAAQTFPNRPVRVVVAFSPGTTSDIIGRLVADKLTAAMGRSRLAADRAADRLRPRGQSPGGRPARREFSPTFLARADVIE